jgi:hypothetical protein
MNISTADLAQALTGAINPILRWALVLAAVATVVMALLEAAKAVARLRYLYHGVLVRSWLGNAAFGELKRLTLGRDTKPGPLLDQPTDKLMAQVQASSNLALDFPVTFPALYAFLTGGPGGDARDAETWGAFSRDIESGTIIDPATDPRAASATRARARLDHVVARRLDSFQTKTEYWWARLNQLVAVGGCAWVLYYLIGDAPGADPKLKFTRLLIAIVGGTVAPVAKDVATALSSLRAK